LWLRDFTVRYFKGITSVDVNDCGAINAFVGKNNSGKSTILHALDMAGLALSVRAWDRFQPKLEIKDLFEESGGFEMVLTYDDASAVRVTSSPPSYAPQLTPAPNEQQRLKTVLILPDTGTGLLQRRHRTPRNTMDLIENRNYGEINALDMLYAIKFYSDRRERGLLPETYDNLIREVLRYFPDLEAVESDRTEQDISTLTYREYGKRLDILYSGTGLKHFLDVLLKTTVSGANIVLLDEPELGLHPDLQRRFLTYLQKLSADKKIQFFLATHSQVLLNYADTVTLYRVTNTKGRRQLLHVSKEAVHTILSDLGLRPSDIFNHDICLMVEGSSDVVFFEHIIRELYETDFGAAAVAVLQYGGSAAEPIISGTINVGNIVSAQRCTFWTRDRDAAPNELPSTPATKFKNAIESAGFPCHIWSRRELEYYFPEGVHIEAQQGDERREVATRVILCGTQEVKYREAAASASVTVPSGGYLRSLLRKHLTSKEQLDTEIRTIVERLLEWKRDIVGE
jgi:predicted ATPase